MYAAIQSFMRKQQPLFVCFVDCQSISLCKSRPPVENVIVFESEQETVKYISYRVCTLKQLLESSLAIIFLNISTVVKELGKDAVQPLY